MANQFPVPPTSAETLAIATANGQTSFSFDWRANSADQVNVIYRPFNAPERVLVLGVDFSVQGLQNPAGGTVTLLSFSANAGDRLYMYRFTTIDREKSWQNEGDYKADLVNKEQDEIYMIMQENRRDLSHNSTAITNEINDRKAAVDQERQERIAADDALASLIGNTGSGNIPIYDTKTALTLAQVHPLVNAIRLNGYDALGDGRGGLYIDNDNGSTDTIVSGGATSRTWYRVKDVGEERLTDGVINLIKPKYEKWGMFADWQCIPDPSLGIDASPQVIAQRNFMRNIAIDHKDMSFAVFLGDLVDTASQHTTGAAPLYGYPELIKDFNTIMPLAWSNVMPLAGNHDRDGTGLNNFKSSWSYETYRSFVSELFYYTKKGNTVQIFMGDMGGSNSGEILDYVISWFDNVLSFSKDCNVIVYMHQPLSGVYYGLTDIPVVQRYSERLISVIEKYDNIAFVGYGHVGTDIDGCLYSSEHFGTLHINFQTGIPTSFTHPRDNPYSVMMLNEGSLSIKIERWNGTTGEHYKDKDIIVSLKYPISIGGNNFDFNGRYQGAGRSDYKYGKSFQYLSMADVREEADNSWFVPASIHWIDQKAIGRDAQNDAPIGFGLGTLYHTAGGENSGSGADLQNSIPAYSAGGGHAVRRLQSNQLDYGSEYVILSRQNNSSGGELKEVASFKASGFATAGIDLKDGCSFLAQGNKVIDEDRHIRLRAYLRSELAALSTSPQGQLILVSDGDNGAACLAVSTGAGGRWAKVVLGEAL